MQAGCGGGGDGPFGSQKRHSYKMGFRVWEAIDIAGREPHLMCYGIDPDPGVAVKVPVGYGPWRRDLRIIDDLGWTFALDEVT